MKARRVHDRFAGPCHAKSRSDVPAADAVVELDIGVETVELLKFGYEDEGFVSTAGTSQDRFTPSLVERQRHPFPDGSVVLYDQDSRAAVHD